MKWLHLLALLSLPLFTYGYDSGIAIKSPKGITFSVTVNGRVFHPVPGKELRMRSHSGTMVIELVAYDSRTHQLDRIVRKFKIQRGMEYLFEVSFQGGNADLKTVSKRPVYSNYFLYPKKYTINPRS